MGSTEATTHDQVNIEWENESLVEMQREEYQKRDKSLGKKSRLRKREENYTYNLLLIAII